MWKLVSQALKKTLPVVHERVKRMLFTRSSRDGTRFCLPRRIAGRLVWVWARLLTAEPPEEHIVEWLSRELTHGGTFFDIGAHYGWITIAAAHRVGRSGRVIAFEASPVLLDILTYHKRMNRLGQVEIVAGAISDHCRDAVPFFLLNDGLSSRNSLTIGAEDTPFVAAHEKRRHEVRSVTLDGFVERSGTIPDVIKIDVEGAELLVLRGAEELLSTHHPCLILGVHSYWLPRGQCVDQIAALLDRLQYEVKEQHVVSFAGGYIADYLCVQRHTRQ